jgi:hypothetical protein
VNERRDTCCTCRHWQGRLSFAKGKPDWEPGECRALPPTGRSRWPKTGASDWCGAHAEHHPDPAALFSAPITLAGG